MVCVYARNLLAMDMCGMDNDTARRLAGHKVGFCTVLFRIFTLHCSVSYGRFVAEKGVHSSMFH